LVISHIDPDDENSLQLLISTVTTSFCSAQQLQLALDSLWYHFKIKEQIEKIKGNDLRVIPDMVCSFVGAKKSCLREYAGKTSRSM
jgi:hypothetical protein